MAAFQPVGLGRPAGSGRGVQRGCPGNGLQHRPRGEAAAERFSGTFGTPSLRPSRPLYGCGGPARRRGSSGTLRERKWMSLLLLNIPGYGISEACPARFRVCVFGGGGCSSTSSHPTRIHALGGKQRASVTPMPACKRRAAGFIYNLHGPGHNPMK